MKKNSNHIEEANTQTNLIELPICSHSNNQQNFDENFYENDGEDETYSDYEENEEDEDEEEDEEENETDSTDEDSDEDDARNQETNKNDECSDDNENINSSETEQKFKGVRYACDECDANYSTKYSLKDHKDLQHLECDLDEYVAKPINGKYACNRCSVTLREPRALHLHRIRMHNLKSTQTINSLKKRSNAASNPKTKQCNKCGLFVVNIPRHLENCENMINEKKMKANSIMNSSENRTFYEFNREEKFDFLNNSNIFEFLLSILNDIRDNTIGDILDLSLYFYFLIILGLRPGATGKNKGFLSIRFKNIILLKNLLKLDFKCKTGYRIKHIIHIKDSSVTEKISLKLNSLGDQSDFFF